MFSYEPNLEAFFPQLLSQSGVTSGQKRDPEILYVRVSSAENILLAIGSLKQLASLHFWPDFLNAKDFLENLHCF